jgi:hypothetical protein
VASRGILQGLAQLDDEQAKVYTAVMYLTDDAMLWWRRRHGDIEKGLCTIQTWEDRQKELKLQFSPENYEYLARKSLKRLKHTGSIREYVKQFTTLLLDITDMTEKDKLFSWTGSSRGQNKSSNGVEYFTLLRP